MAVLFRSERLGLEVHGGKLPAQAPRIGVPYATAVRPALAKKGLIPTMPEMFGHGHDFPQGAWLMLGNGPLGRGEGTLPVAWRAAGNGCGNCTIADSYHTLMEAEKNAGAPLTIPSAKLVIEQYMERTKEANGVAYNPETGDGDTGLEIQAVIEWLMREGAPDEAGNRHKIEQDPIQLEPGNVQHLWEAVWLYEKVKLGVILCQAQEGQFDASPQPTWDFVQGSPELGGHDIPAVGKLGVLSWGEDVYYTPRFIEKQCDEAWAVLHPEQFKNNGRDYEGYVQGDIEKFSVELATRKLALLR